MKLGEVVPLKVEGVVLVVRDDRKYSVTELRSIPRLKSVKGAFLGVRSRKSDQK